MFGRGSIFMRLLAVFLLLAVLAGAGWMIFRAGQAQGYAMGVSAAQSNGDLEAPPQGQNPNAPFYPGYGYPGFYRPFFFPFFPFFGLFWFVLIFFLIGGLFRWAAWGWWGRPRNWQGPGQEQEQPRTEQ